MPRKRFVKGKVILSWDEGPTSSRILVSAPGVSLLAVPRSFIQEYLGAVEDVYDWMVHPAEDELTSVVMGWDETHQHSCFELSIKVGACKPVKLILEGEEEAHELLAFFLQ